jgi:hypothetical protein
MTTMIKRALALLPLWACVGCVTAEPHVAANLDTLALSAPAPAPSPAPAHAKASGASVQLPPEAARVGEIDRRWRSNGYSERVRLKTDAPTPESRIDLAIGSADRRASSSPDEAQIRAELEREFPDVPMKIAPPAKYRNAYGEFGLAIGRSGDSLRCIYVWQSIDDARPSLADGDRSGDPAPASLRLKLCRSDMTVDQLAEAASRIEIALPERAGAGERTARSVDAPESRRQAAPAPTSSSKRHSPGPRSELAAGTPSLPAEVPIAGPAPEAQRFGAPPSGSSSTYASVATSYSAAPAAPATAPRVGAAYDLPPQAFAGPSDAPRP